MNTQSNLAQAAVILKSLPKPQAAKILSRLRGADIKQVLDTVKLLDVVTADQLNESVDQLYRATRKDTRRPISPDERSKEQETTLSPHFQQRETTRVATSSNHPFGFLIDTLASVRDQVLRDEHPRNIAIVLSSLPPQIASECLKSLEPVVRVSVLRRLCELDELQSNEINELRYALKLRHKKLYNRDPYRAKGMQAAAGMLSHIDQQTQETLVAMVEQSDPELGAKLQGSVIKIDDLAKYKNEDIKRLLAAVDTSYWAPALKKASLAAKQKILANMGTKPSEMLCHEMEELGDVDPRVEQFARQQIINQVVSLTN